MNTINQFEIFLLDTSKKWNEAIHNTEYLRNPEGYNKIHSKVFGNIESANHITIHNYKKNLYTDFDSELPFEKVFIDFGLRINGGIKEWCALSVDNSECKILSLYAYDDKDSDSIKLMAHLVFPDNRTTLEGKEINRRDRHKFNLFFNILTTINSSDKNTKIAIERKNDRHKIKVNGCNKIIKVKKVIHIFNEKYADQVISSTSNSIEYSHRFWVRGHWRKIDENSFGKDRAGEYNMVGKTWVNECIKGDSSLPIINKKRIFHQEDRQHEPN